MEDGKKVTVYMEKIKNKKSQCRVKRKSMIEVHLFCI